MRRPPPVLGDLVLSEFNGGIQQVAAQESLLYLPNFIEFKTTVQPDKTFSVDCMTGKGVPGYICLFAIRTMFWNNRSSNDSACRT